MIQIVDYVIIFVDFKKPYDSIDMEILMRIMEEYGVDENHET